MPATATTPPPAGLTAHCDRGLRASSRLRRTGRRHVEAGGQRAPAATVVVMTGCGHAGVVNTVTYAQRLTGVERVHAIIGGFHLNGPIFEPLIPKICDAFTQFAPDIIVPAHCTGWKAVHRMAAAFPDAFVPNSVGSRFELRAPEAQPDQ